MKWKVERGDGEPSADPRKFVGDIVVDDGMDDFSDRNRASIVLRKRTNS